MKDFSGSMMGPFSSFASLLFCVESTIICTSDKRVLKQPLVTVFPTFYKPTRFELLEVIARQTSTSFKFCPNGSS